MITDLISLILAIIGETTHTFNAVGWIAVAAYLILTVVYGYYWLIQPREMTETQRMEQPSETMH